MGYFKPALIGLAVAIAAYVGLNGLGKLQMTASVADQLAPSKEVTEGDKNSDTKTVTKLAPKSSLLSPHSSLTPTPSVKVSVTPHPSVVVQASSSATPTPKASLAPSVTPHTPTTNPTATPAPSVTPHTPTPSPSATATPSVSPTDTPTPSPTPSETPSPSPTPSATPEPGTVTISEIGWAGTAANATDEWIELYNSGSTTLDLTGWSVYEGTVRIIVLNGSIGPGAYFLIERTDDTTVSDILADTSGPFSGAGLSNEGEDLQLHDAPGATIDRVDCTAGWFAGNSGTKTTMERIGPNLPGNVASSWATNDGSVTTGLDASGNPLNGTPKYGNSVAL